MVSNQVDWCSGQWSHRYHANVDNFKNSYKPILRMNPYAYRKKITVRCPQNIPYYSFFNGLEYVLDITSQYFVMSI